MPNPTDNATRTAPALQAGTGDRSGVVPLCQLRTGDHGRVMATECDDCELLRAMGMSEHCRLRVCRSGAPCIVEVNSTRLGLSPAMTERILVEVDPPASARS